MRTVGSYVPRAAALALSFLAVALLGGCERGSSEAPTTSGATAGSDKTIKLIMSDIGFNAEVVQVLEQEVANRGYVLDWVVVNDIIQPNKLVNEGAADANWFQHEPYFDQFVADHGLTNITRGFYTITSASGLYSRRYKSLSEVPDGATFGIPVDPANNGRALFMLRDRGLLSVREGVSVTHASLKDVTANPHGYKFKEVDQLMQMRALEDVDVGFLFSNYALLIGLDPQRDALAREEIGTLPYLGIVAVRKELRDSPKIKALQQAAGSDAVKAFYRSKYGDAIVFLDHLNH